MYVEWVIQKRFGGICRAQSAFRYDDWLRKSKKRLIVHGGYVQNLRHSVLLENWLSREFENQ